MKDNFEIQYETSNISAQETEVRLFRVLSLLLTEEDIYKITCKNYGEQRNEFKKS